MTTLTNFLTTSTTYVPVSLCDAPVDWNYSGSTSDSFSGLNNTLLNNFGFQDPASPLMEGLISLHADIWAMMLFVAGFVGTMLFAILRNSTHQSYKVHHHSLIEIIWTTVPAIILCIIAIPSFALLYGLDELVQPNLTVKAIGRQWYWSYEYGDYDGSSSDDSETGGINLVDQHITFDSNVLQDDDLEQGMLRLLDVDNRLVLPVNKHIRLLTSAGDVIHSFAVPSLGIKLDAIPGRLNQTMLFIKRQGVFYGQCSELCGTSHSMMPIALEAVDSQDYIDWVNAQLADI